MAELRICSIVGCRNKLRARGLCVTHYNAQLKSGTLPTKKRGTLEKFLNETALTYKGSDCLIWPFGRADGRYGAIVINGHQKQVHRVVCETVHGQPPTSGHVAAHNCGNGHLGCVNPSHIEWKTPKGNCADRAIHGRWKPPAGEKNHNAKLSHAQVEEIRSLAGNLSQAEIGRLFGVSQSQAGRIIRRDRWR